MEGWSKILTIRNRFLADIVTMDLQAAGWNAVLVNKKDSSYVALGFCEVFVPASQLLEAQVWLLENHPEAFQE
ncbi:MAG: DUF2007 domain-containing protein [Spirosomataceae bacterium]